MEGYFMNITEYKGILENIVHDSLYVLDRHSDKQEEYLKSQDINVQSAAEQKTTEKIWNFVSVPNVTAIMSTVRIICLHIRTYNIHVLLFLIH